MSDEAYVWVAFVEEPVTTYHNGTEVCYEVRGLRFYPHKVIDWEPGPTGYRFYLTVAEAISLQLEGIPFTKVGEKKDDEDSRGNWPSTEQARLRGGQRV